jgi:hypothetical protein
MQHERPRTGRHNGTEGGVMRRGSKLALAIAVAASGGLALPSAQRARAAGTRRQDPLRQEGRLHEQPRTRCHQSALHEAEFLPAACASPRFPDRDDVSAGHPLVDTAPERIGCILATGRLRAIERAGPGAFVHSRHRAYARRSPKRRHGLILWSKRCRDTDGERRTLRDQKGRAQ